MQNIKDKYVICSFGMDSHKLVKVKSETKAKFTFEMDYRTQTKDGFPSTEYTQMKNTIVAVGTKKELQSTFDLINEQEKIMSDARIVRQNILRGLRLNGNQQKLEYKWVSL